jgi:hypothetical protein
MERRRCCPSMPRMAGDMHDLIILGTRPSARCRDHCRVLEFRPLFIGLLADD